LSFDIAKIGVSKGPAQIFFWEKLGFDATAMTICDKWRGEGFFVSHHGENMLKSQPEAAMKVWIKEKCAAFYLQHTYDEGGMKRGLALSGKGSR